MRASLTSVSGSERTGRNGPGAICIRPTSAIRWASRVLTCRRIHGPATRSLDYFPITIDNGAVIVDTSKVTTRQSYEPSQATKLG